MQLEVQSMSNKGKVMKLKLLKRGITKLDKK